MRDFRHVFLLVFFGLLNSCGILLEDRWAPPSPDVKTESPEAVLAEGIRVELGDRSVDTQMVVVTSLLKPEGISAASQFDLSYDPNEVSLQSSGYARLAPQVAAVDKGITCQAQPGFVRCLVYGLNQNLIPNGPLATLAFQVVNPSIERPQISVRNVVMSTANGTAIPIQPAAVH